MKQIISRDKVLKMILDRVRQIYGKACVVEDGEGDIFLGEKIVSVGDEIIDLWTREAVENGIPVKIFIRHRKLPFNYFINFYRVEETIESFSRMFLFSKNAL